MMQSYVKIGDGKWARKVTDRKYLPTHYRALRDKIFSFKGDFKTMVTITLSDECMESGLLVDDLEKFQNLLKCHYIGVLEHGESARSKNPIKPHYHFLVEREFSKKIRNLWRKHCRKGGKWKMFDGIWFDKIKNEKAARRYVAKYAKGKRLVKDYDNPPEGWEDVHLPTSRVSQNYQKCLETEVSFTVENDVLEFFRVNHYDYLKLSTLRLIDHTCTHITFDSIDWSRYRNVEVLWLVKSYLARKSSRGGILRKDWNFLIKLFSEFSAIILRIKETLESVALMDYGFVYEAARTELKNFERIPERFHPSMLFTFEEWEKMTSVYYSHRREKRPVESYMVDQDEEQQLILKEIFQELE